MCEHCERSYSEVQYADLQTVCECGHLIMSQSHLLPVRRRLTKKQSVFAVGFEIKTSGNEQKPAQIGKVLAHNSGLAPTLPALVVDGAGCRIRCRRKTTPACTSPKSPLLSASFGESRILTKGSRYLNTGAENWQATPSSPKKRSIDQIDETRKDIHIKKPRSSLSRPWRAGGA